MCIYSHIRCVYTVCIYGVYIRCVYTVCIHGVYIQCVYMVLAHPINSSSKRFLCATVPEGHQIFVPQLSSPFLSECNVRSLTDVYVRHPVDAIKHQHTCVGGVGRHEKVWQEITRKEESVL